MNALYEHVVEIDDKGCARCVVVAVGRDEVKVFAGVLASKHIGKSAIEIRRVDFEAVECVSLATIRFAHEYFEGRVYAPLLRHAMKRLEPRLADQPGDRWLSVGPEAS